MINNLILCINYNSYPQLENYIKSIDNTIKGRESVDVYIADNSTNKKY